MTLAIGNVTFLVRDYDEAIDYFTKALGFTLLEDTLVTATKRRVVVAAGNESRTGLLLSKASSIEQEKAIGNQCAGRVAFFLNTTAFDIDHARMQASGVIFQEAPRHEAYGKVAVFTDLYGNRWDLLEDKKEE